MIISLPQSLWDCAWNMFLEIQEQRSAWNHNSPCCLMRSLLLIRSADAADADAGVDAAGAAVGVVGVAVVAAAGVAYA